MIFQTQGRAVAEKQIQWEDLCPGLWKTELSTSEDSFHISSNIVLIKFDPSFFDIKSKRALSHSTAMQIAENDGATAVINANFFDKSIKPLGLIISNRQVKQKIHAGGNTLSGIFFTKNKQLFIKHRDNFTWEGVDEAIQSGPRIIADGKPLSLISPHSLGRRSGIAITQDGFGILYITTSRFPGLSLAALQNLLLNSDMGIKDALNLDGGGSAQLYLNCTEPGETKNEVSISGDDDVPAFLILVKKNGDLTRTKP